MKPNNVNEALDMVQTRLLAAGSDLWHYLINSEDLLPEDMDALQEIKDTVLDAHLLVTWIKDNK